jgi:hypothetical protein
MIVGWLAGPPSTWSFGGYDLEVRAVEDIGVQVEPNALTALSGWAALDRCVLPFAHRDGHIEVLVPDASDLDLISWIQFATGCCVIAHEGDRELVCKAIRHYYQLEECDVAECIDPM